MGEYHTFVSYAREDDFGYIRRFVGDLEKAIKVRTVWDTGRINFFDAQSVRPGEEWPESLSATLQSARTILCIYTPRYFQSWYCGREVSVFRDRIEAHMRASGEGAPAPPAIIPILWLPESETLKWLPESMKGIQYKHEDFGAQYPAVGVHNLIRQNRNRDAYLVLLDGLAKRLVEAAEHRLAPLPSPPSLLALANAFESPAEPQPEPPARQSPEEETAGPRFVQFIFVAGRREELSRVRRLTNYYGRRGDEWQPYLPEVQEQIYFLTADIVLREKLIPQVIELDEHTESRLEEAERENNIVVIVVDTWTLHLERYSEFMRKYDRREFVNCVVIIPWNLNDPEALESQENLKRVIRSTFQLKAINRHPDTFYEWVNSPDVLRRDLSVALNKARARVIEKSKWLRKAERDGVYISKPVVEGPGRASDAG